MDVMKTAIMAMLFAVVLTACGAGGFTHVRKPTSPFNQYSTTAHGKAETSLSRDSTQVLLLIDRFEPYQVVNFDVTITGYDASGFIVFTERAKGQIAYPHAARPFKWPAPGWLSRIAITKFETEGW